MEDRLDQTKQQPIPPVCGLPLPCLLVSSVSPPCLPETQSRALFGRRRSATTTMGFISFVGRVLPLPPLGLPRVCLPPSSPSCSHTPQIPSRLSILCSSPNRGRSFPAGPPLRWLLSSGSGPGGSCSDVLNRNPSSAVRRCELRSVRFFFFWNLMR
jgi:hypothetical protein